MTADSAKPLAPAARVRPAGSVEKWGLVVIALAVAWFYLWTATTTYRYFGFEKEPGDYYNFLVDGFLDGRLSLKYSGDPGILKLKDPYDPAQNAPYRVLDMSYYKGKYYIYFGPAPALVLLLPLRLITGSHLPAHLGVVFFCAGGYWISLLLMLRLRRWYFPETGTGPAWLAALLLGLASMAPVLLRRPSVYELAIACGYFFLMLALWMLHFALSEKRHRVAGLAVASAAYGFAILARPTYLYGAVIFGLLLGWWWRRDSQEPATRREWLRRLSAAAGPLGLIFFGMLLYNYLRFDNPLEFGQIYQLSARNMSTAKAFGWNYFPFNAWLYLLMPAQHSGYFPFFLNALPPPMPEGYDGFDDLYGLLPNLPVVLLAAGIFLGMRGRDEEQARELKSFVLMLAAAFIGIFGVFLFFSGATIRYYLDFLPVWLLLVCLGMWSVGRVVAARRWWRIASWSAMSVIAFFSMTFAVMVSFQHGGLLRTFDQAAFQRLAYAGNFVSLLFDRVAGTRYGPLKVELKFPRDRRGQFEPLVVSGAFPAADYLWVLYTDDQHLQIGFEHTGHGGTSTQPIRIDYAASHTLEIDAGFLYPPESHPYFDGKADEAAQHVHRLRVWVDGVPYLDRTATFYDPVSPRVVFGRNRVSDTFGRRFTGEILGLDRSPLREPLDLTPRAGVFELAVVLPTGNPGAREPLVVTGKPGHGDLFYVQYVDAHHVRFGLDHWGVGTVVSEPVESAPGSIQVIEVSLGSLASEAEGAMKNRLMVRFDGNTVLDRETAFHAVPLESQTVGINLIGGSECGPAFSGKILSVKRRQKW